MLLHVPRLAIEVGRLSLRAPQVASCHRLPSRSVRLKPIWLTTERSSPLSEHSQLGDHLGVGMNNANRGVSRELGPAVACQLQRECSPVSWIASLAERQPG